MSAELKSCDTMIGTDLGCRPGRLWCYEPLATYAKMWVTHAPGMPGTVFPPARVSDPDMHHGTCVSHSQLLVAMWLTYPTLGWSSCHITISIINHCISNCVMQQEFQTCQVKFIYDYKISRCCITLSGLVYRQEITFNHNHVVSGYYHIDQVISMSLPQYTSWTVNT